MCRRRPNETEPALDERVPASLQELPVGRILGSLTLQQAFELDQRSDDLRSFLVARYRDEHERYLDADGPLPPALVPDLANQVLSRTVRLGPWIHTASETTHFGALRPFELEARGRVVRSYRRKGHEIVELDVGLYCGGDLRAHCRHRAIIRPAAKD